MNDFGIYEGDYNNPDAKLYRDLLNLKHEHINSKLLLHQMSNCTGMMEAFMKESKEIDSIYNQLKKHYFIKDAVLKKKQAEDAKNNKKTNALVQKVRELFYKPTQKDIDEVLAVKYPKILDSRQWLTYHELYIECCQKAENKEDSVSDRQRCQAYLPEVNMLDLTTEERKAIFKEKRDEIAQKAIDVYGIDAGRIIRWVERYQDQKVSEEERKEQNKKNKVL